MPTICPTITAEDEQQYQDQIERIKLFATRVHIDLADGVFTPNKLIAIDNVWWPGGLRADLHVMYQKPFDHTELLIDLAPQLIIVQAEAEGDFAAFADNVHHHGIETGVALLPETGIETIEPALPLIDHVLIFSGNLGYQGGSQANLDLLEKVKTLKDLKPTLEIGWDGGISEQNVSELASSGVDVLNVGGFIQKSNAPIRAYRTLVRIADETGST